MMPSSSIYVDFYSDIQRDESICISVNSVNTGENSLLLDAKDYIVDNNDVIVLNLAKGKLREEIKEIVDDNFIRKLHSVPRNISNTELIKIQRFVENHCQLKKGQCKIYAYNLLVEDNMDLTLTLLIVNRDNFPIELDDYAIKIYDANNKLIVDGKFNVNTSTHPERISIKTITISKDNLIDKDIDLNAWRIIF